MLFMQQEGSNSQPDNLRGCEVAVHAMRKLFKEAETDGVLLVDAKNAFNMLNRKAAMWNVHVLCTALGPVTINTYRASTELFVGGETLLSREGTTQGDPLAMAIYAVAIIPLIHQVSTSDCTQTWFADNARGAGELSRLRE